MWCLYGWAATAAQTGGKARAQHSPFFCRNGSRFSFRHSSLSSTNLRIDASSTCVGRSRRVSGSAAGHRQQPKQAWGSGQLPACLCRCPHLLPQAFDSPKPASTTVSTPHSSNGTQEGKSRTISLQRHCCFPLLPRSRGGNPKGLPGSCSQIHSSPQGSCSSWRCDTGAARPPEQGRKSITDPRPVHKHFGAGWD